MISEFQRQSRRRKIVYGLLIVALFSASLAYRPLVLESHADKLELREQNQGEVDPVGAAVRLSLTGSRGFALWVLWWSAIEKQKKHEWNELEVLIGAITQLQPHFITPWLFQSWNLAYNVSAESDRVRDKYFYITRGIELLARGERVNRNHPDLRFNLGYYYLDKIGMADQQRSLRTLLQLSCIDPQERDPARMRTPVGAVDLVKFQRFCEDHPHVVRRLREEQLCRTPDDVLDFLAEHKDVPSRFETSRSGALSSGPSRLKPAAEQFPVLPNPADIQKADYEVTADQPFRSDFDNYAAAQSWFTYAQTPLPPAQPVPGASYRIPRAPDIAIFRCYPALAQTRLAEQMQRDGWFDSGWQIDEGKRGRERWFADKVVVGEQYNSGQAWERAFALWRAHGVAFGLWMEPAELAALNDRAKLYRDTFGVRANDVDRKLRPEDFEGDMRAAFEAHVRLANREYLRGLTRFPHFYAQAEAMKDPQAVQARALFFQARRKRQAADPNAEIRQLYEQAFPIWREVLLRYPDFRHDLEAQQFTYRIQQRYLDVVLESRGSPLKQALAVQDKLEDKKVDFKQLLLVLDLLGQGAQRPPVPVAYLPPPAYFAPGKLIEAPQVPFDGLAPDGQPFISPEAVRKVRNRIDYDEWQ